MITGRGDAQKGGIRKEPGTDRQGVFIDIKSWRVQWTSFLCRTASSSKPCHRGGNLLLEVGEVLATKTWQIDLDDAVIANHTSSSLLEQAGSSRIIVGGRSPVRVLDGDLASSCFVDSSKTSLTAQ